MWSIKTFANYRDLLAWLNDKENVIRIQNVQIVKSEQNSLYEVFYWDSWAVKKEYY